MLPKFKFIDSSKIYSIQFISRAHKKKTAKADKVAYSWKKLRLKGYLNITAKDSKKHTHTLKYYKIYTVYKNLIKTVTYVDTQKFEGLNAVICQREKNGLKASVKFINSSSRFYSVR